MRSNWIEMNIYKYEYETFFKCEYFGFRWIRNCVELEGGEAIRFGRVTTQQSA